MSVDKLWNFQLLLYYLDAVDGLLLMDVVDDRKVSKAEKVNQELLDKYPDEYRNFRNEILLEIQPDLEAEFEKEKNIHNNRIDEIYENKLLKEKERLIKTLEQNMEDEIKRTMVKERKFAERRKVAECKRSYAKIKTEVMKAKEEGIKVI